MASIQRRLNVDATSWRCIDVEATLYGRHVSAGVALFFYLSPDFYICTLIVDIIVKNNYLRIICNSFQDILSKIKEMTFTEMNKGSKSRFAYE